MLLTQVERAVEALLRCLLPSFAGGRLPLASLPLSLQVLLRDRHMHKGRVLGAMVNGDMVEDAVWDGLMALRTAAGARNPQTEVTAALVVRAERRCCGARHLVEIARQRERRRAQLAPQLRTQQRLIDGLERRAWGSTIDGGDPMFLVLSRRDAIRAHAMAVRRLHELRAEADMPFSVSMVLPVSMPPGNDDRTLEITM